MHVEEAVDRPEDLVVVERSPRPERVRPGHERAPRGQRRNPEPQQRKHRHPRQDQPPHRRNCSPRPDRVQPQEQPHLRPSERGKRSQHERPSRPPGQVEVDRAEAQRDDDRIRLEAQDVVPVVPDTEERRAGEHRGDHRRIPALGRGIREPVRDPSREDDAAERDGDRGDHPQPQLVVAEHGVRDQRRGQRKAERGLPASDPE